MNRPYRADQLFYDFSPEVTRALETAAQQNGVTLSTVMHAIWGLLLHLYNGVEDAVFASVVSGRPPHLPGIEKMVGMGINAVPVRVRCSGETTFAELLQQVHTASNESDKYDYFPLFEIQARSLLNKDLINHVFVFENYPLNNLYRTRSLGFRITDIQVYGHPNYDFNIVLSPGPESLSIKVSYNEAVYDRDEVREVLQRFKSLAWILVKNLHLKIKDLEVLTSQEKHRLLTEWNRTQFPVNGEFTVHAWFERQVQKNSDKWALVCGEQRWTYGELNAKAGGIAAKLRKLGIGAVPDRRR